MDADRNTRQRDRVAGYRSGLTHKGRNRNGKARRPAARLRSPALGEVQETYDSAEGRSSLLSGHESIARPVTNPFLITARTI